MSEVDELRCAACGARNPATAPWCSQCFAPVAVEPPPAPPAPTPPPPANAPATPAAPAADGLLPLPPPTPANTLPAGDEAGGHGADSDAPRPLQAGSGRFRQAPDGLEWSCTTCAEWNPIERLTCSVCREPFGDAAGGDARPPRPEVAAPVLVVTSLVVPGAGHWLLGLRGRAALLLVLAMVWGLGGVSLLLRALASGQPALPAIPLLLGWIVVAAGAANDAVVEGGGDGRVVLNGRVMLWLTVAVVGGTLAAAFVGVLSAVGG